MSKYQQKLELIKDTPNCPRCGCKMIVLNDGNPKSYSNVACIKLDGYGDPGLICFQCVRIESKQKSFDALSFWKRFKISFDKGTGIISGVRRIKRRIHNYWYLNICGNPKTKGHKKI